EIPKNIKDKLKIVPVKWIDEVIALSLQHVPRPLEGDETNVVDRDKTKAEEGEKTEAVLPH
ncbi:MAG TPA: hypothetical protein VF339_10465, partial [Gammaproteobacteria bacterium]